MRLKELRKAHNYKQTEIADMLSCTQGVYSRYESEEREPPFDIIKKLAEIYGVTIDYLMGDGLTANNLTQEKEKAPADDQQTQQIMAKARKMNSKQKQALLKLMDIVMEE